MTDSVHILGARGSIPVSGPQFSRYGGATTCVLVRLGGQYILLDGGTGLLSLPEEALCQPELPLLLSHPHADHMLGLALCPYLFRPDAVLAVYAAERDGLGPREQMERLFSPPLWPVTPGQLPAALRCHTLSGELTLGPVKVTVAEGRHPGGVTLFRLSCGERSVVFLTDCTLTEDDLPRLTGFAEGCDLLLADGQYSDEEWAFRSGFGHSTWTAAARLGAAAGAKQVRILHHDPSRTDEALFAASRGLSRIHPRCSFAYEGEEVYL